MKKRIAIAMGGFSDERPISLKSAETVIGNLNPDLYEAYPLDIGREGWKGQLSDGNWYPLDRNDFSLRSEKERVAFDAVFNCIHGTPGEDGILAAYLELMGIPQTSCSSYPAALTFNKRDTLSIAARLGVPTGTSVCLNEGDEFDTSEIVKIVGLPLFVKANRSGSSIGIYKVKQEADLSEALKKAFEVDREVIVEQCLIGTEVSVGVIPYLGSLMVLPMTEIVSENDFFDYAAKYEGKSEEITPARISDRERREIADLALLLYRKFKLRGYTRSEFILHRGLPHLLEVNTTPGLTNESILPQQAAKAGIDLPSLFSAALEPLW